LAYGLDKKGEETICVFDLRWRHIRRVSVGSCRRCLPSHFDQRRYALAARLRRSLIHHVAEQFSAIDQVVDELFELARVIVICKCFGPLASAVMNGRLISVVMSRAQFLLGLFARLGEPLQGHVVLRRVDSLHRA